MPANAAGKLVFALACAASALAAVAAAGADGPPCPGLMIGTQPLGSDIMRNGLVMAQWAFGRPGQDSHVVGDEVALTMFYLTFTKGELPLKEFSVNHTDPDMRKDFIKPELQGPLAAGKPVVRNVTEAAVVYNCFGRGGLSEMWTTLVIARDVVRKQCGVSTAATDLTLHFAWRKFCNHEMEHRRGLAVGTQPGMGNVVLDGDVTAAWRTSGHSMEVASGTQSTTFYVTTMDDTQQVVGPPRLEGVVLSKMHAVISGPGLSGGVATSDTPVAFIVTYYCDSAAAASQSFLTMALNLCAKDVQPAQCNAHNSAFEPLVFQWTKNCIADPPSSGSFGAFFSVVLLLAVFGCMAGCFYKHQYVGSRGVEVLPFIDTLRSLSYVVEDFFLMGRPRRSQYSRANMSEEDALNAAGKNAGSYQVDGSVLGEDDLERPPPAAGRYGTVQ